VRFILLVIAGLVPAISLGEVRRSTKRDARVKHAHDELRDLRLHMIGAH
jgi:hypothetical protein